MANLKEIQRQIKSVKNTQKTTNAMKLVSSAKLRRTEQLSKQAKSYATKLNKVLRDIAVRVNNSLVDNDNRIFGTVDKPKVVDIIVVTADKGLCGGFNFQTIKAVSALKEQYESQGSTVRLRIAGRKGIDYFSFNNVEIESQEVGLSAAPDYELASKFITQAVDDFKDSKTDKVVLVHNGFLNMLAQELKVENILPIELSDIEGDNEVLEIEPKDDDEIVLDELVGKYIDFNMYFALIDSLAAEHSARMQAMDNATSNAKDRVNALTIEFNKARQAAITTELIEIISGSEALN
jgi:F-type H+-transporting ATPase subunit gamma